MNGLETTGKLLIIGGSLLVLLGGLLWMLSQTPLGRLPGDVRIEKSGFTCLIPIASSIILSILLTILLNVVIRIVQRLIH